LLASQRAGQSNVEKDLGWPRCSQPTIVWPRSGGRDSFQSSLWRLAQHQLMSGDLAEYGGQRIAPDLEVGLDLRRGVALGIRQVGRF